MPLIILFLKLLQPCVFDKWFLFMPALQPNVLGLVGVREQNKFPYLLIWSHSRVLNGIIFDSPYMVDFCLLSMNISNFISYENPVAKNSVRYFVIVYASKYLLSDLRFTKLRVGGRARATCGMSPGVERAWIVDPITWSLTECIVLDVRPLWHYYNPTSCGFLILVRIPYNLSDVP